MLADWRTVPQKRHALVRLPVDIVGRRRAGRRPRHGGAWPRADCRGACCPARCRRRRQHDAFVAVRRWFARRLCRWLPRLLRLRRHLAQLLLLPNRCRQKCLATLARRLHRPLFRRRCSDVHARQARAEYNSRNSLTSPEETTMKRILLLGSAALTVFVALPLAYALNPQPLPPSPEWAQSVPSGPVGGTKITEDYARQVARDAVFWAWPMVNVYNRRLTYEKVPEIVMTGAVPAAPLNRLGMLSDYIVPEERIVACPNQDVVYGVGALALDKSPVVIQVPDFGDRFWVYQIVDLRTDSFADLGKMYGTTPGFYLLVGPDWKGEVPKGISGVFRASTKTGYVVPRVFQDDSPEDNAAVRRVTQQIM